MEQKTKSSVWIYFDTMNFKEVMYHSYQVDFQYWKASNIDKHACLIIIQQCYEIMLFLFLYSV